jgi:hypothetical protein
MLNLPLYKAKHIIMYEIRLVNDKNYLPFVYGGATRPKYELFCGGGLWVCGGGEALRCNVFTTFKVAGYRCLSCYTNLF